METIKEEKMWELLKKIAKAGWKPYGKGIDELTEEEKNIRLITSRNSGLWQFVCENCLLAKVPGHYRSWDSNYQGRGSEDRYPEYRLIESALKDESELENFLLNSIKLD